ncbi:MAG: hypothetical protein ABEJ44_03645 [Halanaeroarchaeum sp.]
MPGHDLSPGDELFDRTDATYTVTDVHDDGSVRLEITGGEPERFAVDHRTAEWSEAEILTALSEGLLETTDDRSAELVDA